MSSKVSDKTFDNSKTFTTQRRQLQERKIKNNFKSTLIFNYINPK